MISEEQMEQLESEWSSGSLAHLACNSVRDLQAENERLVDTLQVYANPDNWGTFDNDGMATPRDILFRRGMRGADIAKEALNAK